MKQEFFVGEIDGPSEIGEFRPAADNSLLRDQAAQGIVKVVIGFKSPEVRKSEEKASDQGKTQVGQGLPEAAM